MNDVNVATSKNLELNFVPDHILTAILEHLELQELLHASRLNKHFHALVSQSEILWKKLILKDFGVFTSSTVESSSPPQQQYKDLFIKDKNQKRRQLAAQRHHAAKRVQILEKEVYQLQNRLKNEVEITTSLKSQLQNIQKLRQDSLTKNLSEIYWQPSAVTRAHAALVTQCPVDVSLTSIYIFAVQQKPVLFTIPFIRLGVLPAG